MKVIIDTENKTVSIVEKGTISDLNTLISRIDGKKYGSWTLVPYIEVEYVTPEKCNVEYPITPCQTSTTL